MNSLFDKYPIQERDARPMDPQAQYFVPRLDTDPAARSALRTYARRVEATNPRLARKLRARLDSFTPKARRTTHR